MTEGVTKLVSLILVFLQLFWVNLPHVTHYVGQHVPVWVFSLGLDINDHTGQFQTLLFDPGHDFRGNPGSDLNRFVQAFLIINFFLDFSRINTQDRRQPLDNPTCILKPQVYQGNGVDRLVSDQLNPVAIKNLTAGSGDVCKFNPIFPGHGCKLIILKKLHVYQPGC